MSCRSIRRAVARRDRRVSLTKRVVATPVGFLVSQGHDVVSRFVIQACLAEGRSLAGLSCRKCGNLHFGK